MMDRFLSEARRDAFTFLTGLVGLVALFIVYGFHALGAFPSILNAIMGRGQWVGVFWIWFVTTPAGWGGLVYACWIRSGKITDTALAFVLALGACGMTISGFTLAGSPPFIAIVCLLGTWIMTGLGIVWIVHKVRRIRAASNIDSADAAR